MLKRELSIFSATKRLTATWAPPQNRTLRNSATELATLLVLFLAMCSVARGQSSTTGAIGGAVTDQQQARVPGAEATARNTATNASFAAKSDANGRYIIDNLQPGSYDVEVSVPNFSTFKANVIVEVGLVTPLDARLNVSSEQQTVTVTGEAPVVNTEEGNFSANFNQTDMANLPINGRRWSTYALATPGVVPDGTFGSVSFRGISGLLNNNTIDGGDNNQAFFADERGRNRISYSTSQEAIQEFQVNAANYSAQYGRAAGGVINAVTKSGTNQFHGDLFFYDRDNALGATNPFTKALVNVNGTFVTQVIKPEDQRYQFGGDIGGYIIRDRLFWYFNYDQQKRNFPLTSIPNSPANFFSPLTSAEIATLTSRGVTAAQANAALTFLQGLTGVVPRTGDQGIFFPRIDWKITANNTLMLSGNRLRWNSPNGVLTGPTTSNGLDSIGSDFVKGDSAMARWTSLFAPSITNEFRFVYGRDFEYEFSNEPVPGEPVDVQGRSPNVSIGGAAPFSFGKPNSLERRAYPDEKHYQIADTLSVVKGSHLIKFGFDVNRVGDVLDSLFQEGGVYTYSSRADFISDYAALKNNIRGGRTCVSSGAAIPCYSNFVQGLGPSAFSFVTWDLAFFVQDDWRINPRLTINAGLRWDYEKLPPPQIPNPALPATATFPSDKNNFGPRLGFAWDLTGQGKTVFRGGGGIFYGRIINSTISNAITNTAAAGSQFQITPIVPSAANAATAPLYPNIVAAGSPSTGKPDIVVFAPHAQNPMVYEYDIVFEHQIARNTAVSASYVGSTGRDLPRFTDTNLPAPTTATWTIVGGPLDTQKITLPAFVGPRPNPNFGRFTTIDTSVNSQYHSMVLQFNRRLTQGLQFQTSYTLAKATDAGQSSLTFTSSNNVLNPFDLSLENGPSIFDIRHRLAGSLIWQPSYFDSRSAVERWLLAGYTFAPIVTVSSGLPYTALITGNLPSTGAPANGAPVSTGVLGAGGTNRPPFVGRDAFRLPSTAEVDLRIARAFRFGERVRVEVFAEAFNLFNRVNYTAASTTEFTVGGTFAAPTLTYNSATFGTLTNANSGTSTPTSRQVQVGAHFSF
jgi:hypothetical protein